MTHTTVEHVFRNESLAAKFAKKVRSEQFTVDCEVCKPDSVDQIGRASVFVTVYSRRQADFIWGLAQGIDAE